MDKFKGLLNENGVRPTYQRLKILEYLHTHETHPTIDEIYLALVDEIPTMSKTTVYNTLTMFTEKRIASPILITGTEVRYEANTGDHHHFYCEQCGAIIDIDIHCDNFRKGSVEGHRIDELHGYYRGVCRDCLKKT